MLVEAVSQTYGDHPDKRCKIPCQDIVSARTIAARRHLQIQKITTVAANRHASAATDPRSVKNRMMAVNGGDARAWIRSLAAASKRAVSLSRTSSDSQPSRIAVPLA